MPLDAPGCPWLPLAAPRCPGCRYVGLPMPGMLPSEASAAANSSFAWIYIMSLFMLDEK